MSRFVVSCRLFAVACFAACTSPTLPPPSPAPWFTESAHDAGLTFVHKRGDRIRYWFPEIMSGGAALFDYDNDGDLDLYLVQGGDLDPKAVNRGGSQLYKNLGQGKFTDVTKNSGLNSTEYGMGAAVGDYDRDGDLDLYVTHVGPNSLYRNDGDGRFSDVTAEAGVGDPGWGTSSAFFDYDNDGDLDLFVVNYVRWSPSSELTCYGVSTTRDYCKPAHYNTPTADVLYRNQGNGRFVDVSAAAGLDAEMGTGLGVIVADFNSDHFVDVYVANDGMPNRLWMNQGDGTFKDQALLMGCAVSAAGAAEASMGIAAVDVDEDSDLDIFMTNLRGETNALFVQADGMFSDGRAASGLGAPSLPYTGFGVGFADFDHDGHQDVFIANGKVGVAGKVWDPQDPYAEPNLLMRGVGGGRLEVVEPAGGTTQPVIGSTRAAAFGDLDNDGDVDVVLVESGGPVHLLLNQVGHQRPWVGFKVLESNGLDAIGATVRIGATGGFQHRTVQTAYSYCASNDPRVHFGLGGHGEIDGVEVRWVDGRRERFPVPAVRQVQVLRRGLGEPVPR